ncbi:MAG: copper resistance protein CopC [Jatrophihabitantaceae bacterium]
MAFRAKTAASRSMLVLLTVLLALAGQLKFSAISQAHSVLLSSTPADGAVLTSAPAVVDLRFSEAVDLSLTKVRLVDSAGTVFAPTAIRLSGEADLIAVLPALARQTYRLDWQTVASDDRHATSGVVVFGIGNQAPASAPLPADPLPSAAEVLLRWVLLLGLSALVGGLVLTRLGRLGPRGRRNHDSGQDVGLHKGILAAAVVGGIVAVPAAIMLMLLQSGGPIAAYRLMSSPFGERSAIRAVALLVLLFIAWRRYRCEAGRPSRSFDGDTVVALLILVVSSALLGHGATSLVRTGIESLHLLLAMIWFGSLLATTMTVLYLLRAARAPGSTRSLGSTAGARSAAERSAAVRSASIQLLVVFGVAAIGCVAGLVITGLLLVGDSARTVDSLLMSTFGRILLVKVLLAAIGGSLGWLSHRRLRARLAALRPGALVAEVAVLAVVIGTAAALASASPPNGGQWRPSIPIAGSSTVSGEIAGLVESIQVRPNVVGHNFVMVSVFNTRRPAPAPVNGVAIRLTGPAGRTAVLQASRTAAGDWQLPTDAITVAGNWQVTVVVSRPGRVAMSADYPWTVGGRVGGPARLVVSQARLAPLAGAGAAGLTLVLLGIALVSLLRRRRRDRLIPGWPPPLDQLRSPGPAIDGRDRAHADVS